MGIPASRVSKPPLKWINVSMWQECMQLSSQVEAFSGLCTHIATNPQFWLDFAKVDDPYIYLESQEKTEDLCKLGSLGRVDDLLQDATTFLVVTARNAPDFMPVCHPVTLSLLFLRCVQSLSLLNLKSRCIPLRVYFS